MARSRCGYDGCVGVRLAASRGYSRRRGGRPHHSSGPSAFGVRGVHDSLSDETGSRVSEDQCDVRTVDGTWRLPTLVKFFFAGATMRLPGLTQVYMLVLSIFLLHFRYSDICGDAVCLQNKCLSGYQPLVAADQAFERRGCFGTWLFRQCDRAGGCAGHVSGTVYLQAHATSDI